MAKKKTGKHLQFYMDCMVAKEMPRAGLCSCSWNDFIDEDLLSIFKPDGISEFKYWASGVKWDKVYIFTPLRQTIVLFMAAMAGEL